MYMYIAWEKGNQEYVDGWIFTWSHWGTVAI